MPHLWRGVSICSVCGWAVDGSGPVAAAVGLGGAVRQRWDAKNLALAEILRAWDFLGVYDGEGGPDDDEEYDDLVNPLRAWLAQGLDSDDLSRNLAARVADHYGIDVDDDEVSRFTRNLHAWWHAQ